MVLQALGMAVGRPVAGDGWEPHPKIRGVCRIWTHANKPSRACKLNLPPFSTHAHTHTHTERERERERERQTNRQTNREKNTHNQIQPHQARGRLRLQKQKTTSDTPTNHSVAISPQTGRKCNNKATETKGMSGETRRRQYHGGCNHTSMTRKMDCLQIS